LTITKIILKENVQARGTVFAPELDAIHNSRQHEKKLVPCPQPTYPRMQITTSSNVSWNALGIWDSS